MVREIKDRLLKEKDAELNAQFLPVLEKEYQRIDGQMGWGYPDTVADYIQDLRDAFGYDE